MEHFYDSWESRIILQTSLKSILKMYKKKIYCIHENNICPLYASDTVTLEKRIGSASGAAEAWLGCFPRAKDELCSCKEPYSKIAIKKIPMTLEDVKEITKQKDLKHLVYTRENLQKMTWSELYFMEACTKLVLGKITPNLPIMFSWHICDDCKIYNENILNRYWGDYFPNSEFASKKVKYAIKQGNKIPCVIISNEYANGGDLNQYVHDNNPDIKLWENILFQIVLGIYTLRKHLNMIHFDLHMGNVLIRKSTFKQGYWRYKIDGNIYDIPYMGVCAIIWDFGWSIVPEKIMIPNLARQYMGEGFQKVSKQIWEGAYINIKNRTEKEFGRELTTNKHDEKEIFDRIDIQRICEALYKNEYVQNNDFKDILL